MTLLSLTSLGAVLSLVTVRRRQILRHRGCPRNELQIRPGLLWQPSSAHYAEILHQLDIQAVVRLTTAMS